MILRLATERALRATLLIVAGFSSGGSANGDCVSALADAKKAASAQDYQKFDQTPGQGWRQLAEQQSCFLEAGDLIDSYLATRSDLRESQRVNLSFHAGQVYAFGGRNDEAVKRFRNAVRNPSAPPQFKWSEYVLATIAFLDHDADALVKNRDVIADATGDPANQSNLRIIDFLIANFDKPYQEALRR